MDLVKQIRNEELQKQAHMLSDAMHLYKDLRAPYPKTDSIGLNLAAESQVQFARMFSQFLDDCNYYQKWYGKPSRWQQHLDVFADFRGYGWAEETGDTD